MKAGCGRVVVESHAGLATYSELSSTYPLKLISSRNPSPNVAVVYSLSYGGGLVAGDIIELQAEVQSNAALVFLTQGSTKVFKMRPARPCHNPEAQTRQYLSCNLIDSSFLLLLPDPVTCFRNASYTQVQTFHLDPGASLVLLDWITSGRSSTGEAWAFARYYSSNQIFIGPRLIAHDTVLLDHTHSNPGSSHLPARTIADRLAPYSCYATLILIGDRSKPVLDHLKGAYERISVFQRSKPESLIWSLSPLAGDERDGWVARVAATDTEAVRSWLGDALGPIESVVGPDVHRRLFG